MPGPTPADDPWVSQQSVVYELSELDGCAVAIDATYFIQLMLDNAPSHEPLMAALGGLTGIDMHINAELDRWAANNVVPFFVFDGQPVVGQDGVSTTYGLRYIATIDAAWELYFGGRASEAVSAFGSCSTFRPQMLYPLLQQNLRKRNLHFLVPPYNAAAQIAYFDMIDSDQCAAIMGSQELLLYPIHDCVIRSIDWEGKSVLAMSKKHIVKNLNVSDPMFVDALLMTGTSFLPLFPPLRDNSITPRQPSVMDATNMLRTSEKNVATLCASFHDIVQAQDPNWLDKFRKARMAIDHFIYVAESGEIQVNDYDKLTGDNHEYLGFQLPSELFHYLNTGLIGPRVLSWITHCQITVLPTVDGYVTDEYRKLVSKQLVPYHEIALGLIIPRLNRGLHFRNILLKVWYDDEFSLQINHRNEVNPPDKRIDKWNVTKAALDQYFPKAENGSIAFEASALANKDFVNSTLKAPKIKGIVSADAIVSLTVWRLLTLNGYVKERTLELTPWGVALAKTLAALEPLAAKNPEFPGLYPAALLAFELIRLGLLTFKNQHEDLQGLPANGTEEDRNCTVLISRAATLLQLRQDSSGYTGPLSKNLLNFHSLTTTVGEANRHIIEALLASMFMNGQAKRERSDYWEISHRLPFSRFSDAALGIAVKTFLDEANSDDSPEAREARKQDFPKKFVPHALHLFEDFDVAFDFVNALCAGVETLGDEELPAADRAEWETAKKYLKKRR